MYRVNYTLFGENFIFDCGDFASARAFALGFLEWTIMSLNPYTFEWTPVLHSPPVE